MSRVFNLTFHGLGDPPDDATPEEREMWVRPDAFRAALDEARDRDDVCITFDDGYTSDVEIALPALVERGLTAKFFPVAGRIGQPGFVDEDEIRVLAQAGMTIGSHGFGHISWRSCSDVELERELVEARERLEGAAGQRVDSAAPPFGAYDRRVLRSLRAAGFLRAYTCDRGPADSDAWLQTRTTVTREDGPDVVARITRPSRRLRAEVRAKGLIKRWR